MLQNIVTW